MKFFVYAVILIVAAAVVAGFFMVGSPQEERLRRFDDKRVSDLQFLQSEIISYWQNKNKLPDDLVALRDDIRGIYPPNDPESGAAYGYEVRGPLSFSLCANFVLPSLDRNEPAVAAPYGPTSYYASQNWTHDAGSVCFERTIDKDIYGLKTLRQ
ncbi:MAG: hypothetical protein UY23_C0001G0404 [Candidatus Jorgensenbacteria bacterium GW2011_GWA1_48_11]|uniref:Type II secretion system protein GspG C-terminal domain-containing protein n=1 Tax=Candidatus Jorgensenbacteria bacterium GW2011_GWA1_48_11 TaxID=1618660 RepID=A0A0G1WN70_9BACT|nr:MAG: hypothetical protein UY23_C0001G0404 [Candidatus Jorgensenbacteria bacterium GW2011_GWA1_48_11]KKW12289.1 MAG: hypothetical protein UY51_C0005G0531 [Candidatus Jorgensenbacteria bacterium GW2011_GWB1_49_9]